MCSGGGGGGGYTAPVVKPADPLPTTVTSTDVKTDNTANNKARKRKGNNDNNTSLDRGTILGSTGGGSAVDSLINTKLGGK